MTPIDILFDGPPDHIAPRFIEVESPSGVSIAFGDWTPRKDGNWALRFYMHTVDDIKRAIGFLSDIDRERILDRLNIVPSGCERQDDPPEDEDAWSGGFAKNH